MSDVDMDVSEGWVRIYHPDLGDAANDGRIPTTVVTTESFEDNHSEKGFVVVGDSEKTRVVDGTTYVVGTARRTRGTVAAPEGGDV